MKRILVFTLALTILLVTAACSGGQDLIIGTTGKDSDSPALITEPLSTETTEDGNQNLSDASPAVVTDATSSIVKDGDDVTPSLGSRGRPAKIGELIENSIEVGGSVVSYSIVLEEVHTGIMAFAIATAYESKLVPAAHEELVAFKFKFSVSADAPDIFGMNREYMRFFYAYGGQTLEVQPDQIDGWPQLIAEPGKTNQIDFIIILPRDRGKTMFWSGAEYFEIDAPTA